MAARWRENERSWFSRQREKLGDLANRAGDEATARAHWQTGLSLLEERLAINPGSAQLRRFVAATKGRLGLPAG